MTPSPRPQLPPILRFLRAVPLHVLVAQIILSCAALSLALPVCAQKDDSTGRQAAAQAQFARAQALRATLEARPERARSIEDYKDAVSALRRVYLTLPRGENAPAAIESVGELYQQMGKLFDATYLNSAIETYRFLTHEYAQSPYCETALLAIAAVQRNGLGQADLAEKSYEDFLKQYPNSGRAAEARDALAQIRAASLIETPGVIASNRVGTQAQPQGPADKTAQVGHVRVWNADTYTRIVVDLGNQAKYRATRLSDPDRIYFDIPNAKLSDELAHQTIQVPKDGYLKSLRVAQTSADVVSVVLELTQVKDYSTFELANPGRLVIDVYGQHAQTPINTETGNAAPVTNSVLASVQDRKNISDRAGTRVDSKMGAVPVSDSDNASALPAKPAAAARSVAEPARSAFVPVPMHNGSQSLTRVLGLKIGRIVIDAGHGGHDTGTVGPAGLMEKDVCLDVALRVGRILTERLPGTQIVYTRDGDKFVSLEKRTAIANDARADLFLSIHANSSDDPGTSGVETYYLNFSASPEAMEVAARENAAAQSSVHDLRTFISKIAQGEKTEESRDFAGDIENSLAKRMGNSARSGRDRGVRQAPFVVLIGANMPSALAEISFLSNPTEEQWLTRPENRETVAEGLYHGIEAYLQSTNSLGVNLESPGAPPANATHGATISPLAGTPPATLAASRGTKSNTVSSVSGTTVSGTAPDATIVASTAGIRAPTHPLSGGAPTATAISTAATSVAGASAADCQGCGKPARPLLTPASPASLASTAAPAASPSWR